MKHAHVKQVAVLVAFTAFVVVSFGTLAFAKAEQPMAKPEANAAISVAKIDINKAGLEDLESVKGIGPALAERIIAYRNENGKFKTAQDIMNVKGIGQSKYERIKDQLIAS